MDRIQTQEIVQGMVAHEECRQEKLKSEGKFEFTPYDALMTDTQRLACLMEEVGEVSRCVLARMYLTYEAEERPDERILSELTQVAAITQAWMERIVYDERLGQIPFDMVFIDADKLDVETGLRRPTCMDRSYDGPEDRLDDEGRLDAPEDRLDDATGQGRR